MVDRTERSKFINTNLKNSEFWKNEYLFKTLKSTATVYAWQTQTTNT